METEIIIVATAVSAIILWVVSRKLTREFVESVTIWDYQTGLHFRDGKYISSLEPGKHRLWGRRHSVLVFDRRMTELVVQGQELITSDSATVKLTAVVQWKIAEAHQFQLGAENPHQALYTRVQLAMRNVIGGLDLDMIVARKADFGKTLLKEVEDEVLSELGIQIARIEIRDVMLSGELKTAYAGVLTARKEAQAQQEKARGDAAAMRTFANAARVYENNPELFRLRYLETLKEVGTGYGNQMIVGVPEELLTLIKKE